MSNDVMWKRIPEFPQYVINAKGDVMNVHTHKLRKPIKGGKWQINLSKEGRVYRRGVRKMLYAAFHKEESLVE